MLFDLQDQVMLENMLMSNINQLGVSTSNFEEALVFHSKDGLKERKIDKLFEKLDEDINFDFSMKLGKKKCMSYMKL